MIMAKCFFFVCCLMVTILDFSSGTGTCCFQKAVAGCDSTLPLLMIDYPQKNVHTCDPNDVNNRAVFQEAPVVSYPAADPNLFYTLIMEDPDAPNHLEGEAWLHWIVANISGISLTLGDVSEGFVVTPYKSPNPPKGSGVHRYLTYVFSEPPAGFQASLLNTISNRRAFRIEDYACERGLCGPLAFNMFKSKHHSE